MNIIPRKRSRNFDSFFDWKDDFDSFFTNALSNYRDLGTENKMTNWSPSVNISETPDEFKVKAEIPGIKEKDIDLTFQDNTLYIKGEKKFEEEEKNENYHRIESSYGSFMRSIPFSSGINEDKIKAKFKDGVLDIRLAKSEDSLQKSRKISISS